MSARNQQESTAFIWLLLIVGLIAGFFSLLAWPFRAVAKRLPGRRERALMASIEEFRKDAEASRLLLDVLCPGQAPPSAKLEKSIAKAERRIDEALAAQGWAEDLDGHGLDGMVIDLLEKSRVVGSIDWRADPEALEQSLQPLLTRRGVSLDWSFVKAIEASRDFAALRNNRLLPTVGDHVERHGLVLAQVVDGSDSYTFAVCTPEEFARIDGVTCRSFTIRRLSSATGPAPAP